MQAVGGGAPERIERWERWRSAGSMPVLRGVKRHVSSRRGVQLVTVFRAAAPGKSPFRSTAPGPRCLEFPMSLHAPSLLAACLGLLPGQRRGGGDGCAPAAAAGGRLVDRANPGLAVALCMHAPVDPGPWRAVAAAARCSGRSSPWPACAASSPAAGAGARWADRMAYILAVLGAGGSWLAPFEFATRP